MEENDGKAVFEGRRLRHCYRCNKSGVPIKNALCEECRDDLLEELATAEWLFPLGFVILLSGITMILASG